MNAQHTRGPWRAEKAHDLWLEIVAGEGLKQRMVADCVRENDAGLIAAAPDLLQALIDVVGLAKEMHEHWDNDRDMKVGKYLLALSGMLPGYDGRTEDVHKAIAKAIGIA